MENVKTIIKKILEKSHMTPKINRAKVFLYYDKIVGKDIAKISQPTSFRNNVLFIGVKNPAWSHQLYFFKPDIINKINFEFDKPVVKDIRFHIVQLDTRIDNRKTMKEDKDVTIPDKKLKMVYNISSEVKDKDLRDKLADLMIKDIKYKIQKGGK